MERDRLVGALGSGMNEAGRCAWPCRARTLYAGGEFITAGDVTNANYIAQWDGTNWSSLGSGLDGGVEAFAVSGTNLYVGGGFAKAGGSNVFFVTEMGATTLGRRWDRG